MTTMLSRFVVGALFASLAFGLGVVSVNARARSTEKVEPKVAHTVIFALKDATPAVVAKFVARCHKYLGEHEGTVSFEVGTRAEDIEEGPSVKDWEVALLLVFENKAALAKYIKAPRHVSFVEENRSVFGKVRVFDSYLTTKP